MRIANLAGRAVLLVGERALDIGKASGGALPSDPQELFLHWEESAPALRRLAAENAVDRALPYDESDLRAPVPAPRQVFAVGVNYPEHAAEAGADGAAGPSPWPQVFTKFPSCLTGPAAPVVLPAGTLTDWEVELVVVIGRRAHRVAAADAWPYVAGLTVGQDLSDRLVQLSGPAPQQYSLGKSYPGFGPLGPAVVTPDALADPDDVAIGCELNGERMQHARTSQLTLSVPALIEKVSSVTPLLPGDLLFTGTPEGIGGTRTPPRFLAAGDVLTSWAEGIGGLRTTFTEA
ncbi:fumarylacetoacetate hydrolase family protein [Streptomyces sp. NPDC050095]|uniref:fumarylacetoacetate hydrolase family protein n=1 Tax=unclassified Streptomyces TaxID=2593676 RepID=UPI00341A727A